MQIGNVIGLELKANLKKDFLCKRLFKLESPESFRLAMSSIANRLRNGEEVHIQILKGERFKFHEVRTAYFAFLNDVYKRADHDGRTVEQLHNDFKAVHLIPIICATPGYEWFSDLVLMAVKDPSMETAVNKLITISDGSIVTTPMLREYFKAVEQEVVSWG